MYFCLGQMWPMWGMGWMMWPWFLVIGGILYIFFGGYRPRTIVERKPSPIEIARLRYARGEITLEEFEVIKRTIKLRFFFHYRACTNKKNLKNQTILMEIPAMK